MKKIPNFKSFDVNETVTAVGFGMNNINNFGLGGGTPQTGYSMSPVAGIVGQSADAIGSQAYEYETNENSDHTAEGYIEEAKKHVNESIDKAYENYGSMDEGKLTKEDEAEKKRDDAGKKRRDAINKARQALSKTESLRSMHFAFLDDDKAKKLLQNLIDHLKKQVKILSK